MFGSTHQPEGRTLLDRGEKNGTIRCIRFHFTFNNRHEPSEVQTGVNVCGQVMTLHADGTADYDFSRVNRTFREYVSRGMKPVVEFDFFPDGDIHRSRGCLAALETHGYGEMPVPGMR